MTSDQADQVIVLLGQLVAQGDAAVLALAFILAGVKAVFCAALIVMFFTGLQALKR